MRSWQTATLIFFVYAAATAYAMPEGHGPRRRQALFLAGCGILCLLVTTALPTGTILATWVLPPALLLVAYWTSGSLFAAPMDGPEQVLMSLDRRLGISRISAGLPRPVAEFLEVAYVFVYPLIPIALGLYVLSSDVPDTDRFWMVILTTDYVCFGMLPWIQTRPPRVLEGRDPWNASFRRLNRRLLDRASIHVNTMPSGHAAEAVAAALIVSHAPLPVLLSMAFTAVAICTAAVLGRYHYTLDVLAGAAVAVAVWAFTS